jgi:anti-sigma factor RsiW
MSECTSYRPLIGAREGELPAVEAQALASHLAGCAGCRRWAADLAATEGLVSEALLAAASARDFAPFVDGVMARVEVRRAGPLGRLWRSLRLHPRVAVGVALAPLLAAALVIFVQSGSRNDVAAASLDLTTEGAATMVIQTSDGPLVLIDDDDDES